MSQAVSEFYALPGGFSEQLELEDVTLPKDSSEHPEEWTY